MEHNAVVAKGEQAKLQSSMSAAAEGFGKEKQQFTAKIASLSKQLENTQKVCCLVSHLALPLLHYAHELHVSLTPEHDCCA